MTRAEFFNAALGANVLCSRLFSDGSICGRPAIFNPLSGIAPGLPEHERRAWRWRARRQVVVGQRWRTCWTHRHVERAA